MNPTLKVATSTPPILPAPHERPEAEVVIYDGHCQFCQGQVARLHRWDWRGQIAFLSLHDPAVSQYCGELTHEQLMDQMYVIDRQGGRHGGAAAIRYLSRRLPGLWWLAPALHIPFSLPIWNWLYRQVAIRRYRWNQAQPECEDGACRVHLRP